MQAFAQQLFDQGVVVVPLFTAEETRLFHQQFLQTLVNHTPELVQPIFEETTPPTSKKRKAAPTQSETNSIFVEGGFGALAVPSSFHNPTVRSLRSQVDLRTRELFAAFANLLPAGLAWNKEQLLDRFCIRRVGTSTTAESWHRDQSPKWSGELRTQPDVILGGWINLDPPGGIQKFSCNPTTHKLPQGQTGFAPLSTEESKEAKTRKVVVEIPPGHYVMFFQNLVHEVYPTKSQYNSMRQFVGYRLTTSTRPFFDDVSADSKDFKGTPLAKKSKAAAAAVGEPSVWSQYVFEQQGVPPIPSGQRPPMYPKLALCFRKANLVKWAETLHPNLRTLDKSGLQIMPLRHCPSLQELQLPLFPAYSAAELSLHTPQPLLL